MTKERLYRFIDKHRIITNWDDFNDVSEYGDFVERDGESVAMYIEQGYNTFSIYTTPSPGNPRLAYRVSMVLAELNRDKDVSILNRCMDMICQLRYDSDNMTIPRSTISDIIDEVISGDKEVYPIRKKWYFIKNGLNKEEKRSIVCTYMNETTSKKNFSKVESAVRSLIDCQTVSESFITINDVVGLTKLSRTTVEKYIVVFRDEINECNLKSFDTENYSVFMKNDSIGKISSVIEKYIEEEELRMTRKKVSVRSKLHYNTVKGLWMEDDVQKALNRYNKWKKEHELQRVYGRREAI